MAMVQRPYAEVTYTFLDETGSKATTNFYAPAATPVADLITAADALRALLAALTGCIIVGQSITYGSVENAPTAAAAGSRVENKGLFVMGTAAGKFARFQVPGILQALLTPEGRIDEDLADPAAFLVAVAGAPWTDSNGSDLTTLSKAYQRFRSTTRNMLPSKREPDLP